MDCPNCKTTTLTPTLTRKGVEIDLCRSCKGVWLDKGELFHFVRSPKVVAAKLSDAIDDRHPGEKLSPRAGKPMDVFSYEGVELDYCPESGGLWFDADEMKTFLSSRVPDGLNIDARTVTKGSVPETVLKKASGASAALAALPNLFLRSIVTFTLLFGLLGFALVVVAEASLIEPTSAVIVGIVTIGISYLISPFIMDWMLPWMYRLRWVEYETLPSHLRVFVDHVCTEERINVPRFGIIEDGAPQAFTYGHTPQNARIVVSRGLFDLLTPEEVESVVAHEIGHAVNWDILLMTLAQMVPLILYHIYKTASRAARHAKKEAASALVASAVIAFLLYIVSEFLVLAFSRVREYHADRFSSETTGDPSRLASALTKIAYGLAGREPTADGEAAEERNRSSSFEAIGALGIFDAGAARSLAISAHSPATEPGAVDKESLKGAMRWDLWNPWAKWFELNSTHPLVANRLLHLAAQSRHLGRPPFIEFDEVKPESYWDEFLVDLSAKFLPWVSTVAGAIIGSAIFPSTDSVIAGTLLGLGLGMFVRLLYSYQGSFFPEMSVSALLKRVKVSAIRPVPCTVKGTVIGKGVPGYIFSEDFVMRDDTGIIFVDYRQPLAIWEFFFALLSADKYQGEEVVVEGWYRRAPVPYIEIKTLAYSGETADGRAYESRRNWSPAAYKLTALAIALAGILKTAGVW